MSEEKNSIVSESEEMLKREAKEREIKKFEDSKKKHRYALANMDIELDDLEGNNRYIAEKIGIEPYRKLVELLGGGYDYIPQYEKLIKRKKKKYVYEVFQEEGGADYYKTAILCGLSVSTVRRYIKEYKRICYDKAKRKKN